MSDKISTKTLAFIVSIIVVIAFIVFFIQNPSRFTITNNGNFLFYNSPVAVKAKGYIFVSFVTKEGIIVVNKYKKSLSTLYKLKLVESYSVHNYSKIINSKIGSADDHAAPAIVYDKKNNEILLATSYHGSDLYLYKYNFRQNKFSLYKTIKGRYTYPRMMNWSDNIYILLRSQPVGGLKGDLVLRSSVDDFTSENNIVTASEGTLIYGSRPTIAGEVFYVSYSTYHYSNKRLLGWKIVKYNLHKMKNEVIFDLENNLDSSYHSNRPTAIMSKNDDILVGTTITFDTIGFDRFYTSKNKILIITIDGQDGSFIKNNHENLVVAPYYPTSIDINTNGDYFYFGKTKPYSSKKVSESCFQGTLNMYPNYLDRDILYVSPNIEGYSIRNFNNSVFWCANPITHFW